MKEEYLTQTNIDEKASLWLDRLISKRKDTRISFNWRSSALLVLDMQKYFANENSHAYIPSLKAIIPNIQKLINIYQQHNLPVIFTRHINTNENAGMMSLWWKDLITENTPFSEIIEDFDTTNSMIIKKTQYDTFYDTNLESLLREFKVNSIVFTGVMTHLCCETTIRSAFIRGISSFFPIDATATYNEEFHISSFINLSHGFSVPTCTAKILEYLEAT